jgi:hypothetical protein
MPFYDSNDFQAASQVQRGVLPKRERYPRIEQLLSPDTLWDLLVDCWKFQETERPGINGVSIRMKEIVKLGKRDPAVVPAPMPRHRADATTVNYEPTDGKGEQSVVQASSRYQPR